MTGGEKVLIVGAAGLGIVAFLKYRSATALPVSPSVGTAPTGPVVGGFVQTGPVLPQFGPVYAALKPIADNITTPLINKVNSVVGGYNAYGAPTNLTQNPDGTFSSTDQMGIKTTYNKDGTVTRTNTVGYFTPAAKQVKAAATGVKNAAVGVVDDFKRIGSIF
jgi:hypothetical protein